MPGSNKPRKRFEIIMTDEVAARLEWLKANTEAPNLTEVVKDALELKESVTKLQLDGCKILVHRSDGVLHALFEGGR